MQATVASTDTLRWGLTHSSLSSSTGLQKLQGFTLPVADDGALLTIDEERSPAITAGTISSASGTLRLENRTTANGTDIAMGDQIIRDGAVIGQVTAWSSDTRALTVDVGSETVAASDTLVIRVAGPEDLAIEFDLLSAGTGNAVQLNVTDITTGLNFSVETALLRDGQPVGVVTGWNADDRSLTVDSGSVQLAAGDALSLDTGSGTEIALNSYSLLGITSGEGVILSITSDVLDEFVAEATLRRENTGTYEKVGVITAWDNVTKTLTVELDEGLTLGASDKLWMGVGNDSPIPTTKGDLIEMVNFAIEAVSGGSARIDGVGYADGQAPTVGGVAYQIVGSATQAIGTTEAVDGASLTLTVDDDKTLLRGADIEATIVPHAVLRLGASIRPSPLSARG